MLTITNMNIYDELPNSPKIDPAVSEAIIKDARTMPMTLVYVGDNGRTTEGNSVMGYRYYDSNGVPIPRDNAEPFSITG